MSASQDAVRAALGTWDGLLVYKPSDRDVNWKPCDYMVWWGEPPHEGEGLSFVPAVQSAWLEVKQTRYKTKWVWMGTGDAQLRPSQIRGVQMAAAISLPYFVALYWAGRRYWTLHRLTPAFPLAITFDEAISAYGVGSAPANLGLTLRSVLEGQAGL